MTVTILLQNTAAFLATFLGLIIALLGYLQHRNLSKQLPPIASISHEGVTKCLVDGTLHRYILGAISELGLVFRLREAASPVHHFVVCDSALARIILEGNAKTSMPPAEKRSKIKIVDNVTMNTPSIVSKKTHGEGWDWARKGVSPAFSITNLVATLPAIQLKTTQFTDVLDQHIAENKVLTDLTSWMVKLTIDFISTTMFATDFKTLGHGGQAGESEGEVYLTHMPRAIKEYIVCQANDIIRRFSFWTKENRDANESASKMAAVGQDILDRYRVSHTEGEMLANKSILGHLNRSPYPSDLHRVADITIFMLAGYDTTAHQLSWIIIELARNPEITAKLREELDTVMGPTNGPRKCSASQLSELHYLGKIIKEGMRLWPVIAYGVQRIIPEDISYKEYVIPKGSSVSINFFALFRTGIQDGDCYIPERWNDDNPEREKLNELLIPFSAGRRNCIGQSLALMELKLVLATLFYSYDFTLIGDFKETVSLTLKPTDVNLKVTRRCK